MKVSELAKQLKTNTETILSVLKSLKLKAKDGKQELSAAVASVIKSEFKKGNVTEVKKGAKVKAAKKTEKEPAKAKKKVAKKAAKKVAKDKDAKKTETTKKKVVKKKVVKKATKTDKADKVVKKKKKIVKKKTVVKDTAKTKPKISKEPLITLKPLSRKRRKSGGKDDKATAAKDEVLDEAQIDASEVQEREQPTTGATPQEAAPTSSEDLADLELNVPITVKDFSAKIGQKPSIVLKQLMKLGVLAHINQGLDGEIVNSLAKDFGFNIVKIKTQEEQLIEDHKVEDEDPKSLKPRAPVITFMGHVDHGKTTLIDYIRSSKVADREHGGITQHIGAYSVPMDKGSITILDTPGHEAFTAMRSRGAHITDIVVLVVAADEGIMPQTEEAIDHAMAADVPIVVALTKIDRQNADPDRVKKQLAERNLASEDWGGKTVVVNTSGTTGEGVDQLLEMILLESELLELKANPDKKASGIVVEAHLSKGKGSVSTLIIQGGTLKEGDYVVVGPMYGKVKALFDDHERTIKSAGPSTPVEVLGLPSVPEAGEMFYVVEDEKKAREISFRREEFLKNKKLHANQKITLEDLYSQIQEGAIKELNVIMKADVQGSLEALKDSLEKIPSDKVKIRFIHLGVGDINSSDVLLAVASKAIIIAFHVGIEPTAKEALEKDPVDIREYRIIYDAVSDMRKALEGLLEAKQKKNFLSRIEIREVFKLTKGIIAGCYVLKGKVHRKANVDLIRDDEVVFSGTIASLKRFKDDVKDVNEGMECGITLNGFDEIQAGDIIEAYEIESIAQKL